MIALLIAALVLLAPAAIILGVNAVQILREVGPGMLAYAGVYLSTVAGVIAFIVWFFLTIT